MWYVNSTAPAFLLVKGPKYSLVVFMIDELCIIWINGSYLLFF